MSRICIVTGKKPVVGNNVSHSNSKTKRKFLPNLHKKRFFVPEENGWVTLKLSANGIRTLNKKGVYQVIKELRAEGKVIKVVPAS